MERTHVMSDALLTVREVSLNRGARQVLDRLTLHVARGELVALMGLSGGGKTTALRVVAGLDLFDAGDVDVAGVALRPGPHRARSIHRALQQKVGMVFQFHCLFEHLSAIDNVALAPIHVHKVARRSAQERAQTLLDQLGVGSRARALPRELSGGEAQRVAIARARGGPAPAPHG